MVGFALNTHAPSVGNMLSPSHGYELANWCAGESSLL